jgi:FMN phosphatase YigB (HAD superfamily)
MKNKHICFDIGNVLFNVNFLPFQSYLHSIYGISFEDTYQFLKHNQKNCDLGLTTIDNGIRYHFRITKAGEAHLPGAQDAWMKSITPNKEMLDLISSLQQDGWKIALLSNMGYEHREKVYPMFADHIRFLSCDVGARKPTTLFFKTFLDLHPEYVVATYIDDLQENLDAGQSFGLKPIKFDLTNLANKSIDDLKEEINSQNG